MAQRRDDVKAINAYLTLESHTAWHAICRKNGVSLTTVLERLAKGHRLHAIFEMFPDVLQEAAELDATRRVR